MLSPGECYENANEFLSRVIGPLGATGNVRPPCARMERVRPLLRDVPSDFDILFEAIMNMDNATGKA